MNTIEFQNIKTNINKYEGSKVAFVSFIPSANRYTTSIGYIEGVGFGVFKESIVINERGRQHTIHYTKVSLI